MNLRVISFIVMGSAATMMLSSEETQRDHAGKIYSVCEVLQNLESLNGNVISVRGIVASGQGTFLIDRCRLKLAVKGYTWPDAIWLLYATDDILCDEIRDAWNRAWDAVDRMRPRKKRDEYDVVMTFVGLLEAKDLDKVTVLNRLGKPIGFGFGVGNLAPAQLRFKTVMNPSVMRKPK